MKALLVLLAVVLFAAPVRAVPALELQVPAGGPDRRAVVVNPAPEGQARPAVIVLHGGRGNAGEQRARTSFDALAEREGIAVVFAEGTQYAPGQHAWNTGYLLRRQVDQADDVAYLDALIDLLIEKHHIDPARVYMTGGSNGAMMTFIYAVRRPERLAAVAPIVGAMFSFDERPATPLPILMINGARDNEVPLEGGMSRNPLVARSQAAPYKSLADTVRFWAAANGSAAAPVVEVQGGVTTTTYEARPGGAVTVSVVDAAGGHGWPGSVSRRPDNQPIQAFDGAERVWSFFKHHARRR